MKNYILVIVSFFALYSNAQENDLALNDTIKKLNPVLIISKQQSPERMPEIKENVLFSGKKNEVLKLSNINGNFTTNNAREIFSRVPGVTIW
jgi:Fe(3+) dicitrate transport protein